ncbi:hypothetical protein R3P38DRAFT_2970014 [Favolaschia claudopus]|uniref:non-specific serine/threonine protein kinase n=1 Tax=Favolaschia claudopus TaxID=2862362 RepID=A0AAW0B3A1_9AGAR
MNSTLRVRFPVSQWPGWHKPELFLTADHKPHAESSNITAISVDPETHSDYCSDSPVFRASIDGSDSPVLALKFALRDDLVGALEQENRVYRDALQALQGTAVPRCFGMYSGVDEDGQQIACLVLEFWGSVLGEPFPVLPLDLKIQILQRLGAIHREGKLLHGDFAERNVLFHEGDVRIIDFDQTQSDHDCRCNMDFLPREKLPDIEEFGCDQLWEVCRYHMRIWDTCSTWLVFFSCG